MKFDGYNIQFSGQAAVFTQIINTGFGDFCKGGRACAQAVTACFNQSMPCEIVKCSIKSLGFNIARYVFNYNDIRLAHLYLSQQTHLQFFVAFHFLPSLSCFCWKFQLIKKGERLFQGAISRHALRPDIFSAQPPQQQEASHAQL